MDKELKAKWVAALRGNEFKKGRVSLYSRGDSSYCCLGVLACIKNDKRGFEGAYPNHNEDGPVDGLWNGYTLARAVLGTDVMERLMHMNDGHLEYHARPHSFHEIADYIEANL